MKIILASSSPRRKELLEQIGLVFEQQTVDFEEITAQGIAPAQLVLQNAYGKAQSVQSDDEAIIIAADTVVVFAGKILGKPEDEKQARAMLGMLSGQTHEVFTGICVRRGENFYNAQEKTKVTMRKLPEKEIAAYVATGEPLDKAGAYGIQGKGALLVERIEGCYFNVVGLPLVCLKGLLEKAGFIFEY